MRRGSSGCATQESARCKQQAQHSTESRHLLASAHLLHHALHELIQAPQVRQRRRRHAGNRKVGQSDVSAAAGTRRSASGGGRAAAGHRRHGRCGIAAAAGAAVRASCGLLLHCSRRGCDCSHDRLTSCCRRRCGCRLRPIQAAAAAAWLAAAAWAGWRRATCRRGHGRGAAAGGWLAGCHRRGGGRVPGHRGVERLLRAADVIACALMQQRQRQRRRTRAREVWQQRTCLVPGASAGHNTRLSPAAVVERRSYFAKGVQHTCILVCKWNRTEASWGRPAASGSSTRQQRARAAGV